MRKTLFFLLVALFFFPPLARGENRAEPAVSRGEFLIALWEKMGGIPCEATPVFTDVGRDDDCATAVGWGDTIGILRGTGEGAFSPDRDITREECAVLLRRLAEYLGRDTFLPDGVADCNEREDISPWADDALYWATDAGIIDWSPTGRLDPGGGVSQAQMGEILGRT